MQAPLHHSFRQKQLWSGGKTSDLQNELKVKSFEYQKLQVVISTHCHFQSHLGIFRFFLNNFFTQLFFCNFIFFNKFIFFLFYFFHFLLHGSFFVYFHAYPPQLLLEETTNNLKESQASYDRLHKKMDVSLTAVRTLCSGV